LKKENESLKKKLYICSNKNNDKTNKFSQMEKTTPFNLLSFKEKYSWPNNYYKSNEKLYKQLYIFFSDKYPKIKNKDISIEEKNVFNMLKDPREVEKFIYYRF
jgi:lantibiotic modifying enzyme